jgi:hypothetical protein
MCHFHLVYGNVTEFGLFFNGRGNLCRVDDDTGHPVLQIQSMGLFYIKSKNFSTVHIYTEPLETFTTLKCLWEEGVLCTHILLLACHISLCVSEMSSYVWISVSSVTDAKHSHYFRKCKFHNGRGRYLRGQLIPVNSSIFWDITPYSPAYTALYLRRWYSS